jgi:transcriptional regulator with XRE-family HTH domain
MAKELDARVIRFGRRIKALRESAQGLSQEALALAVGYSRSAIANLETGRLDPVLGRAFALADYFNMPLAHLVSDHGVDAVISGPGQEYIIEVKMLKEFEDNAVDLVRHAAEALRQGQTEGGVQPPVSPERQAFLDLIGQLEDNTVHLLRRYAEALQQGQTSVADDLDRQLVYIEDALKLRRIQQGEREGNGTESAPAG